MRSHGSMLLTFALLVLGLGGVVVLAVLLWPDGNGAAPCGRAAVPPDEAPARLLVERAPGPDGSLSFSYINRPGKSYLLVFAVDADRNPIWFYPDAESRRQSVPVEPCTRPQRLPPPPPRNLAADIQHVHAVFTSEPLEVDAVETLLQNPRNSMKLLPIRGAVQDTVALPPAG